MARIEELPDDFDESLNLNEAPTLSADDEAVFEEMYSKRLGKKGGQNIETNPKSFEETLKDFSQIPLFMNSLDDATDAGTRSSRCSAIKV
jgi:hypothetical protein